MKLRKMLLQVFDNDAGFYPLHIIPSGLYACGVDIPDTTKVFAGIHFVDTSSLLSVLSDTDPIVSFCFNAKGKLLDQKSKDKPAFYFESMEIGAWCKALIEEAPSTVFEHTDIPFIFKDQAFDEFERLALGMLSQTTIQWCCDQALERAQMIVSPRIDTISKGLSAFFGYYNVLQAIVLGQTEEFVHEANAFYDVAPETSTMYPVVIEKLIEQLPLNRRELGIAYFEIQKLIEIATEIAESSELQEEPEEETIKAVDEELLRLRRMIL